MIARDSINAGEAAEHLTALGGEDDKDVAIAEALVELAAGQGRPFEQFAQEFSDRFAVQFP